MSYIDIDNQHVAAAFDTSVAAIVGKYRELIAKGAPQTSGCILFGSKTGRRYPGVWFDGKQQRAHRAMWQAAFGPIPEGMCVCHKCDVTQCANPDHLFLGTQKDNMQDAVMKRGNRAMWPAHSVRTIAKRYRIPQRDVARIINLQEAA